jgi:hypothetical protein
MKDLLQLCNRLLDDPQISDQNKALVRQFAGMVITTTLRKCGGNFENFEYMLR